MFNLIVAQDSKNGIAKNGRLPFKCTNDMRHFKETTSGSVVIMGRKTWDSIPKKPLPGRINVVFTKSESGLAAHEVGTLEKLYKLLEKYPEKEKFVIGGRQIYELFLQRNLIKRIYITTVHEDYDADLTFPYWRKNEWRKVEEKTLSLFPLAILEIYERVNWEEVYFLQTLNLILEKGIKREDRTGTGTLSIFGNQFRFSLDEGRFPLMTHRRITLRMVFEELKWMIRGQTDAKILSDKKVPVWNDNTTSEFLRKRGVPWVEGDIGPAYGFQLRHYGAEYFGCNHDYTGKGFDQLTYVINLLKTNPDSRRIMFTFWNPPDLHKMALPPCAFNYQFYVSNGYLSCRLTQRSSDISLAGGWNIATASLLTYMLAKVCNLRPYEVIWSTGDTHIYLNQVNAVKEMIGRKPRPFPTMHLNYPEDNDIEKFEWSDVILNDYLPHKKIKVAMNA